MELKLGTAESSYEAEDKKLQKEAAAVTKAARTSVREAAFDVRVAEAALRHERRLEEEREKCWWAAERRDAFTMRHRRHICSSSVPTSRR